MSDAAQARQDRELNQFNFFLFFCLQDDVVAQNSAKRYELLEAFRGFAILWIVCFHVLVGVREQYGRFLNDFIAHGRYGVSIFFAISGYGLAASIAGGAYWERPLSFLTRRLKRIYLPYWWHLTFAALIIPLLIELGSMIKGHTFQFPTVDYSILDWLGVITLLKVFTSVSWRLNMAFVQINGVVWFIAVIVQIYLFLAVCLLVGKRGYSAIIAAAFVLSLLTFLPPVRRALPYGLFLPYFCQFYVGTIAYYVLQRYDPSRFLPAMFAILVGEIGIAWYCATAHRQLLGLVVALLTATVMVLSYPFDERLSRLSIVKLFGLVGAFSYSLYLMHIPLWPLIAKSTRNLLPLPSSVSAPLVVIPVIIGISGAWFVFFESAATVRETIVRLFRPITAVRAVLGSKVRAVFIDGSAAQRSG